MQKNKIMKNKFKDLVKDIEKGIFKREKKRSAYRCIRR